MDNAVMAAGSRTVSTRPRSRAPRHALWDSEHGRRASSPGSPVPVLWWRSVGNSHKAFATEASSTSSPTLRADPLEFRRGLLAKAPRPLAVLELAAQKAGWGTPLPAGHARGMALPSLSTVSWRMSSRSRAAAKGFHIERVVSAVIAARRSTRTRRDAGRVLHLLRALGGVYGNIKLKAGAVQQSNFNDYRVLRMDEMPRSKCISFRPRRPHRSRRARVPPSRRPWRTRCSP